MHVGRSRETPLNDVPRKWWPRQQQDKPDPYTEEERDAILRYYRAQNEFGRKFGDVLRVLELKQRPFYNTRHTYISIALTLGTNSKWVAEQTGTSLAMIEKSYGKYIRDDGDAPLQAYVANQRASKKPKKAKTETVRVFSGRNGTIRTIWD